MTGCKAEIFPSSVTEGCHHEPVPCITNNRELYNMGGDKTSPRTECSWTVKKGLSMNIVVEGLLVSGQ